jgi:hypothetical protein
MLQALNSTSVPVSMLASRAMLRGVRISQWDGRKLDKRASDEVIRQKGASADAGRFNKTLVPPEALSGIVAAASNIRKIHARYTLPWSDNGLDILPAASVQAYDSDMREARMAFETAVDKLCDLYPTLLATAPARLGELFNAGDYPSVSDIRSRFGIRIRTLPMPTGADFRVEMSEAQSRMLREEIERDSREALEAAMKDAWQRVADVVAPMVEKLRGYKPAAFKGEKAEGIFRDTLVENVRQLVAVLPAFNLTNSPDLDMVFESMRRDLCRHDAEALRDDGLLRQQTADAAERILDHVSGFLA